MNQPESDERNPDVLHSYISELHEELADAYIKLSGKASHTYECAISEAPAYRLGPCNCNAPIT